MEGADVDESLIALDESIKNLNPGDGYESDECSTVKSTTSHISGTGQLHYPTDEELSICDSVTSTKERSLSLRQTLSDQRSTQRFLTFVKGQGCANNIKFWFACERFSKLGAGRGTVNPHARDAAKAIYHSFLKSSAPHKVALKDSTVNQIRRSLDLRMTVNPQLFAQAQQEVYDLMVENEYKQFLMLSGDYSDCSSQFTSSSILPADSYYSDGGSSLMGYSIPRRLSRGANRVHGDIESTSIASYSDSEPGTMFSEGSSLMGYGVPRVPNSSRGVSAVHSDVESSIASYSDSEPPRMLAPPRRVQRNPQSVCSDNETRARQTRKSKHTAAENDCVSEQFLKKVSDRLRAVKQDRENMQKAVQEQASRRGQKVEEIQKLEWYDFPSYQKKYVFSRAGTGQTSPVSLMVGDKSNQSPQEDSSVLRSPSDNNKHLDNIAEAELNNAMQHMELSTRQMRLHHNITKSPAVNFASVDSGLSDSGRSLSRYSSHLQDDDVMLAGHSSNSEGSGATLLPAMNTQTDSGLSSDPNPHVTRYLQQQNECSDRDKQAFAAASMLLDSNPHLNQQIVRSRAYMGQLNHFKREGSQVSMSDAADTYRSDSEFYQSEHLTNWMKEQQQRQQKQPRQPKFIRPQHTEESSSDFTMHSSTLFMPVGGPYHPCSDSDDPRYFTSHKIMHRPKTNTDRRRWNNTNGRDNTNRQNSVTSTTSPHANKDPFAVKPGEQSIAVFYQMEGEDAPKRRVVADKDYTLMEFKKLFGKKGDYRYFFKEWCEDVQMEIKDELTCDHAIIPKYQNKIFAYIEKNTL